VDTGSDAFCRAAEQSHELQVVWRHLKADPEGRARREPPSQGRVWDLLVKAGDTSQPKASWSGLTWGPEAIRLAARAEPRAPTGQLWHLFHRELGPPCQGDGSQQAATSSGSLECKHTEEHRGRCLKPIYAAVLLSRAFDGCDQLSSIRAYTPQTRASLTCHLPGTLVPRVA